MAAGSGAGALGEATVREGEHGLGEHGHRADDLDEPSGGRIGNMRGLDDDVDGPGRSGEMRPEEMRPDERLHDERIGNIRGLDENADGPGRSAEMRADEVRPGERVHEERIGNIRGVDEDVTTGDEDASTWDRTTTHTGAADETTDDLADDDTTREKPSLLDRAKDRVDDALGRRDTDEDGRRG